MTTTSSDVLSAAWRSARAAADDAGVQIRSLHGDHVAVAQEVIRQTWGPSQVPQDNLLRALAHAGSALLGATRDGEPVGVVMGFLGWTDGLHLHSHMTGVVGGAKSKGVGFALKLWQRAECLSSGIREIRWTYDPLIARNAYFNIVKLGVDVLAFRPDFYGQMDDIVNAGDSSDRFEVSWQLDSPRVTEAIAGRRRPVPADAQSYPIPRDYDEIRRADPERARLLRHESREQFQRLFAADTAVEWDDGGYLFVPRAAQPPPAVMVAERRG
jgi:predicted GNAT superfamily acetyltransferase